MIRFLTRDLAFRSRSAGQGRKGMRPGLLACLLGLQVGSSMQQMLTSDVGVSNNIFGIAVSTVGNRVLIGDINEDVGINVGQGPAYLFDYSKAVFSQMYQFNASG